VEPPESLEDVKATGDTAMQSVTGTWRIPRRDVVCLDFIKAFDTVSHSVLLEKLPAHGLDGCTRY